MAGFWIKMENNLASKPEVIMLAANFDCDEDLIVGKLLRLWAWFDDQTEDGKCDKITTSWIDRFARLDGFSQALIDCGWMVVENGVIEIPNWDNHNSETAKRRAKDLKRKGKKPLENKGKKDDSESVPDSFHKNSAKIPHERGKKMEKTKNRAEQIRADTEQKKESTPKPPAGDSAPIPECLDSEEFRSAWAEWRQYKREAKKKLTPSTASKQLKQLAKLGVDRAVAAIDHSIASGYTGVYEPNANRAGPSKSGLSDESAYQGFIAGGASDGS